MTRTHSLINAKHVILLALGVLGMLWNCTGGEDTSFNSTRWKNATLESSERVLMKEELSKLLLTSENIDVAWLENNLGLPELASPLTASQGSQCFMYSAGLVDTQDWMDFDRLRVHVLTIKIDERGNVVHHSWSNIHPREWQQLLGKQ